jgi:hypothetical protein
MEHKRAIGGSSEWRTPPEIFIGLKLTFDLDVAAPTSGPFFVPCREFYTAEHDGLSRPWHGVCWCNAPFGGRYKHVPWLEKFFSHGNGIALCHALTSANWFHSIVVPNAELLLFPRGKTKFYCPDGTIGKQPSNGSS